MKTKKKSTKNTTASVPTSGTILNFFNAKAPSGAQRANNRQDSTKRKNVTAKQREIIVIDSDSDDCDAVEVVAVTSGPVKRRKLSPPTGCLGQSAESSSSSSIKRECTTPAPPGQVGRQMERPSTRFAPASALAFGDPCLLAEREPVPTANVASNPPPLLSRNEELIAGLSRPRPNPLQDDPDCSRVNGFSSDLRPQYPSASDSQVDIDLTVGSWDMGDDEFENLVVGEEDSLNQSNPIVPDFIDEDLEATLYEQEELEEKMELADEPLDAPAHASTSSNAFSLLMSGVKEDQAWKEADQAEDRTFRPSKSNRRKAPFYKVLQGMPIAVDAFKYGTIPGVTAYFLTHAHSDHYTNLSSSWTSGPIYCSEGTANLIIHMLSVDKKWVHSLTMDTPTTIPNTGGVQVTLIEANHCPGSCLFFFDGRQTVNAGDNTFKSPHVGSGRTFRYLHCGDFRASPRHVLHPAVKDKRIDHVYLDTTYLDPKYTFPPQALVIIACAQLAGKLASGAPPISKPSGVFSWLTSGAATTKSTNSKPPPKNTPKPVLFVVGTYSIGKERIVKAVAKALNSKVYCDKRKAAILHCQADPELDALITSNAKDASVHLLPLGMITSDKLSVYFDSFKDKYSKIVGFRPTGWTYVQPSGTEQLPSVNTILTRTVQKTFTFDDLKPSKQSTPTLQLYPVPYSEHSSFYELTCFAMSLNWGKMIATVNVGSEKSRAKMTKWVSKWEAERKKRTQDVVTHRHLDYW